MKTFKKIMSLLLSVSMLCASSVIAFASEETATATATKNEILFDQNTYSGFTDAQKAEYVPSKDGKKEVNLSRTVTDEKVKFSVDLKLGGSLGVGAGDIIKMIDGTTPNGYFKTLRCYFDQMIFNHENANQYYAGANDFKDYKNITAILDLKNTKIEAFYVDGLKYEGNGYAETIAYNSISRMEIIWNSTYKNDIYIKNLLVETYVVPDIENKVLFDQNTYSGFDDAQKNEYVPSRDGKKEDSLSKEVTNEKVKFSVDLKLDGSLGQPAGDIMKLIDGNNKYHPTLRCFFDQVMFNKDTGDNNFFTSAGKLKDYKNITAILDLENKKVEALYFDGVKYTGDGYKTGLAYNSISRIEIIWDSKYNNDIHIKNLKVETYNGEDFGILKSDIVNNDTSAKMTNKWTYVYYNADLVAKYWGRDGRQTIHDEFKNNIFTLKENGTETSEYDLLYENNGKLQIYINNPNPQSKYEFIVSKDVEYTSENIRKPKSDVVYTFTLAPASVSYNVTEKDGKKTITVDVVNYFGKTVYTGVYSDNGKKLDAVGNATVTFTPAEGQTAKSFVFDANLKPLAQTTDVLLTSTDNQ